MITGFRHQQFTCFSLFIYPCDCWRGFYFLSGALPQKDRYFFHISPSSTRNIISWLSDYTFILMFPPVFLRHFFPTRINNPRFHFRLVFGVDMPNMLICREIQLILYHYPLSPIPHSSLVTLRLAQLWDVLGSPQGGQLLCQFFVLFFYPPCRLVTLFCVPGEGRLFGHCSVMLGRQCSFPVRFPPTNL